MKDCPLSMNEEQYSRCHRDQLADDILCALIARLIPGPPARVRTEDLCKQSYQIADAQIAEGRKE